MDEGVDDLLMLRGVSASDLQRAVAVLDSDSTPIATQRVGAHDLTHRGQPGGAGQRNDEGVARSSWVVLSRGTVTQHGWSRGSAICRTAPLGRDHSSCRLP